MTERVDFNIANNGVSVGASVTLDYFEERVLPLITTLLGEMQTPPRRRAAARRAKVELKQNPRPKPVSIPKAKPAEKPLALPAPPKVALTAAINCYTATSPRQAETTHILA